MERILVFADGASKGNPGPGGWGAVVLAAGSVSELGGGDKHTTNNKMELQAAIEGIRRAAKMPGHVIEVHTDSSYVINGITTWVKGWKKNGWRTKQGTDVLNRELWEELDRVVENAKHSHTITWRHVAGHAGIAGNERVDELASAFAEGSHPKLYAGTFDSYGIALHDLTENEMRASKKSTAKAYSYVSEVDGAVMVHATWRECEARVRGKKARFKKSISKIDEEAIVKKFSK